MLPTRISARSSPPKGLEAGRGQLGIADRGLHVFVSEIRLARSCVVSLGSERESAGMPQHMRVLLEAEPALRSRALDHAREPCGGERRATFGCEHKGRFRLLLAL